MSELRRHRVALLLPFTRFLEELGAPVQRGFRQSGLPYSCLDDPNNYVPSESFYDFVASMADREGVPSLGFHVGSGFGANGVDPKMARLMRASPSMLTGLEEACELTNRTISRCELGLMRTPDGQQVRFYHKPGCRAQNPASEQIAWFGIMTMLGMIRVFAGNGWRPTEIGVMADGKPDHEVCEVLPNTRMRMAQPFCWISIPTRRLAMSATTASGGVQRRAAYDPLEESMVGALRQIMRSYVLEDIDINTVAELAGTSRRSLQRMLELHGTTFSKLREEVRFEKARRMLGDPDAPIAGLAAALGYRHPTHFARAFRRFAGVSPRQYRKMHVQLKDVH